TFAIFEKMSVSNQHVIMKEVSKQGLTFKDGAFRTPSINPAFEHNFLVLKEKGLLSLEQPGDVLDDTRRKIGISCASRRLCGRLPLLRFSPRNPVGFSNPCVVWD